MAKRKIILLLCAAAVAVFTLVTMRGMMTQPAPVEPPVQAQAAPPQLVEIAAAARDLATGTILKEGDVRWVPWAAGADTSSLLVKGGEANTSYVGAVVRDGLKAGEPIVSFRIAHPHDQGFLAAVLNANMRAMSITLSPSAEVAGFIFPGDRVDVILTHSFTRKDIADLTERRVSETVLQNVRVLALDQRSDNQLTDPKVAQIATLEVSDKDAEKLALANDISGGPGGHSGSLSLVLRSLATDGGIAIDAPDANAAAGKAAADVALAAMPSVSAPVGRTAPTFDSDISAAYPSVNGEDGLMQRVQVMRGKTVTENTFERRR